MAKTFNELNKEQQVKAVKFATEELKWCVETGLILLNGTEDKIDEFYNINALEAANNSDYTDEGEIIR